MPISGSMRVRPSAKASSGSSSHWTVGRRDLSVRLIGHHRLVIGLVLGEDLDGVDTEVIVDDPTMIAAEQQQILHRVNVIRQRDSF